MTSSKTLDEYLQSGESQELALGEPFCRIVETSSGELVVTIHHALFDYWSSNFFYDDIRALMHQKRLQDRPVYDLYAHFISKQDRTVTQQFWQTFLQGGRPNLLRGLHDQEPRVVTADSGINLHTLSKDLGIPVGSLLYTAWAIVLSSELNSKDVTFGVAISCRETPLPGILGMYGPTVTNVPLRLQLDDNIALKAVGKAVQAQILKVSEHAYCGLRGILRASNHDASLFNTAVNFLFRPASEGDDDLELLEHPSPLVRDITKLEVDSQNTQTLSLTSSFDYEACCSVLQKIVKVLQSLQNQPNN